ncbi:MAG: hypothetical protein A3F72_04525 [Bacteroidetes bacterium RIFCSPLOWO2_12_FULL_35_15]|nr:MAG: hypothetical protein A3F72_04525 [Bacteroidetes bacterium RIFCSPLOWO2_12_FULL_35_15]
MKKNILLSLILLLFIHTMRSQTSITFLSKDGVIITADLYFVSDSLPYMILCHQAGYSRGEYKETAPKFTKFGYNCIAIDLRSGDAVNGVNNETAFGAKSKNKPNTFLDAEQDILSAIDYAFKKSNKKVVLVGSSYSASLALKIGTTNDKVKAVIAFSPGEHFGAKLNLKEAIKNYDKPLFAASAKAEAADVSTLLKDIKSPNKKQCTPSGKGEHGSKALWKSTADYHEYWMALLMFMRDLK